MVESQEINYALSKPFPTLKVTAVEETLSQAVLNFKDLVSEFEQLHLENINYKKFLHEQKEKSEGVQCNSCDELRKVVAAKERIIDSITSTLNKLDQSKYSNVIEVILRQIYGDTTILTPPKSVSPQKEDNLNFVAKEKKIESTFKSPKKEVEDQICKDESLSEIEATPTGRKSPILQSRRTKTSLSLKDNKKKSSDSWSSPDHKAIKLTYPTPTHGKPGGRLRQGRLSFVKIRSCNVVDLTCSQEQAGENNHNDHNIRAKFKYPTPTQGKPGGRLQQGRLSFVKIRSCNVVDLTCSPEHAGENNHNDHIIQCNMKKEVIDNDETILPSPTSGPVQFPQLCKSMAKDSPTKFKKPPATSKFKIEAETSDHNTSIIEQKDLIKENGRNIEESINLLNQFSNRFNPLEKENTADESHCGDESISLLQHNMKKVDPRNNTKSVNSPSKRALRENVNISNMQHLDNAPEPPEPLTGAAGNCRDDVKRVKTTMAPVYKEPTVRTKAEKRALPGWSCDQCRIFYDELYKDDPDMLAHLMDECSKHRGRTNPVRPKTPDGFWYPRWDVPQDTEEFNRRNNAV